MTRTVKIDLGDRSYDIRIASGILGDEKEMQPWLSGRHVFVITNEVVAPLYLKNLQQSLEGKVVEVFELPDGENTKTLKTLEGIFDRMLQIPLGRDATVIALGGGVIGDMAGFAASCYQRGIPFIQVPTTLLAQVDSSVGGKTAVNHALGKNMIGSFYQPKRVLIDTTTLDSLPDREFSAGMAEVIKYGMISDVPFFEWLEQNLDRVMLKDPDSLAYVVEQSCRNKAAIVEQDEREKGMRALLNLGHTFGHAIETATGYTKWLHGEAVAIGLVMAANMSMRRKQLSESDYQRAVDLLSRARLPVETAGKLDPVDLRKNMQLDKKVSAGQVRLVLMNGIGGAYVTSDYEPTMLADTLRQFCSN